MEYKTTIFILNIYLVEVYILSYNLVAVFFAISVRKLGHNCVYCLEKIGYRSIHVREGIRN